jgi:hypothetical protein
MIRLAAELDRGRERRGRRRRFTAPGVDSFREAEEDDEAEHQLWEAWNYGARRRPALGFPGARREEEKESTGEQERIGTRGRGVGVLILVQGWSTAARIPTGIDGRGSLSGSRLCQQHSSTYRWPGSLLPTIDGQDGFTFLNPFSRLKRV